MYLPTEAVYNRAVKLPAYLLQSFIQRTISFIERWYIGGAKFFYRADIRFLKAMDKVFAVSINAKNIFKPLYQDSSVFGYFFGFTLRASKIIFGVFAYMIVSTIFFLAYLAFAGLIPFLAYKIIIP